LTKAEDEAPLDDDGLPCPEVGSWAEEKHRLVSLYAKLFSSGMKNKWDQRVYVDLYAGAGYSRIRGTAKIVPGSPIRALALEDSFDKYIFCERVDSNLEALKIRVKRTSEMANVAYVGGDCNKCIADILAEVPRGSRGETTLSLCFADPFDIGLKFETIRRFADARFVDFLILLALYMDANRNYERYVSEDAVKIDEFLGSPTWRPRWAAAQRKAIGFPQFLATEFSASMQSLGYLETPLHRMKRVRSDEKNLPLYYIALFSRHERALRFWDEVLKYGTDQPTFHWE
jgi:three-Cys-motif partner protein